jgi:predicted dienelactone hydrolase
MNMKEPFYAYFKPTLAAAVVGLLLASLNTSSLAETKIDLPGYEKLVVTAAHRSKPIDASIWYPAERKTYKTVIGENPIFYGKPAYVGAALAKGTYPLVILSHGSGGKVDGMAWLASALAQRGALVLGMDHQGSTSGDSSPRRSVMLGDRVADLRAALDTLLADPTFGAAVDTKRISALGFSLGGSTVLQAGGMQFDRNKYQTYCQQLGDAAADCVFLAKGGVDLSKLPDSWEQDLRDPRISSIIGVEPGFTYAANPESLKKMNYPILLINLGKADRWKAADMNATGSNLVAQLPHADYAQFAPAHHFTFLPECKPNAAAMLKAEQDDPICDDPAGTDRRAIHQQIIDKVTAFLKL